MVLGRDRLATLSRALYRTSMSRSDEKVRDLLARVRQGLQGVAKRNRLLAFIAWPPEVEARFFASGGRELPRVSYSVDRDGIQARIALLNEIDRSIDGDDPVAEWLRATVRSYIDGNLLMLAVGTREFYTISRRLYGGARTRFPGDSVRNIDLADHLLERLRVHGWDESCDPDVEPMTDHAFAEALRARVAARHPRMDLEVVVDDQCTAKVVAGMSKVRVRRGAMFDPWELDSLWSHEVETHVLTARNGAAQELAPFLQSGGPRSTRTQEGLAIFAELYDHDLTIARMERLALRVKLVDMAEQGADFLDLYRFLLERGWEPREAFLDAQRICRGGRVEGGAPFTKDVCYLAGLLQVYTFLASMVRGGHRDETEMLVAGRIALEDVPALVELRQQGLLTRPKYLPQWLVRWRGLLPYFAFASFVSEVDLQPVEQRFRQILELARGQVPPVRTASG